MIETIHGINLQKIYIYNIILLYKIINVKYNNFFLILVKNKILQKANPKVKIS